MLKKTLSVSGRGVGNTRWPSLIAFVGAAGVLALSMLLTIPISDSIYLLADPLFSCECGSSDITLSLTTEPAGSKLVYYNAKCNACRRHWQVVDVPWTDPRKMIDTAIESGTRDD